MIEVDSDPLQPLIYPSDHATVSLLGDLEIETIQADPALLRPPDRRLHAVSLTVSLSDGSDGEGLCAIESVVANEPLTNGEYRIDGPLLLSLRAWRLGSGEGRVYTITVSCQSGGSIDTATVEVQVPRDLGEREG